MVVEGGCTATFDTLILLSLLVGTLGLTLFYLPGAYESYEAAYSQVEAGTMLNIMPPVALAFAKASFTVFVAYLLFLLFTFALTVWKWLEEVKYREV